MIDVNTPGLVCQYRLGHLAYIDLDIRRYLDKCSQG